MGNPLPLFSLGQKVNQCMSSLSGSCQKHSRAVNSWWEIYPSALQTGVPGSAAWWWQTPSKLGTCTPAGVTVCCGCAAPGPHPIYNTAKQGTSALPLNIGAGYCPLTAAQLVLWRWFHAFSCSTDISCGSKAALVLGLEHECNLCRGIRSTIHASSSRAAGNRIHETGLARDKSL